MTLERFAAGGADMQPPTPLSEPYILWDTRNWNGSIGVGTGGLANEGTAGPSFNLDVAERILGDNSYAYFAKQGSLPEAFEWVTTSVDWDAIGGPPCDGPVTIMLAIADLPRQRTLGVYSGFPNGAAYVLQYFRNASAWHWMMVGEFYNNDDGDASGYMAALANADASNYKFAEFNIDSNPGDDLAIRLRLLVLSHDIADGGASAFRDTDPIPPGFEFDPPSVPMLPPFDFYPFDQNEPCNAGAASQGSIEGGANEQLNFIGEHRSWAPLTPGQAWNGAIGAAFFRGEPTAADIEYWRDYFLTGYTPTGVPIGFAPNNNWTIRVDDTYVYHYTRTTGGPLTLFPMTGLPTPPTVDLFMIGGGGAGYDINFAPGLPGGGGAAGQLRQASGLVIPAATPITCYTGIGGVRYAGAGRGAGQPGAPTIWDFGSNTPGGQITALGGNAGLDANGGGNVDFAGGTALSWSGGGGAGSASDGGDAPSLVLTGQGGNGVVNDWRDGTPRTYGLGGNGGGREAFGQPDLLPPTTQPFTTFSGDGGPAGLTPLVTDRAGAAGWLCIRYLRLD